MKKYLVYLLALMLLFSNGAYADEVEVRIGLVDTGISTQSIDKANILKGINYIDPLESTNDLIGHGTGVASIIVGSNSPDIRGLAPNVKLVPLLIGTRKEGSLIMGEVDTLAKAIRDAIDIYDCRVINISSGTLSNTKTLESAVDYAEEKGVVLISSVGNDNMFYPNNTYYPAGYKTVIGVSALKRNGQVTSFSQRNASVAICAPGERLKIASVNKGKTSFGFGTSYATSYVSATVALLISNDPSLTPREIRQIISDSADDLGQAGYDVEAGWGALNIEKALEHIKDYKKSPEVLRTRGQYTAGSRIHRSGHRQ